MNETPIPKEVKVWIQIEAIVVVFFTAFGLRWSIGWWMEDPPANFSAAVFFGIGATVVTFLVHFGGRVPRALSYAALGVIAILGGARHGMMLFWNAESIHDMLVWEAAAPWGTTALYLLGSAILLLSVYCTFLTELWGWTNVLGEKIKDRQAGQAGKNPSAPVVTRG